VDGEGTTGSWGGDGLEIDDAGRGERDVSHVASTSIFLFEFFFFFFFLRNVLQKWGRVQLKWT
jgi:hypothetical protein